MQVAKWGNSLAVRLPAAVVSMLDLREGDDVEIVINDPRTFALNKKPDNTDALFARLRAFRGKLPPDFKFNRDEAKVSILGVPDTPGIAWAILGAVAEANIEVDVIIQNISKEGKTDFSFTVAQGDYQRTLALLREKVAPSWSAAEVLGDPHIAKVSIVGIGMRSHVGVAATMFRALSEVGVNIQMISTSEIKTSVVIDEKYLELAVRALHTAFGLDAADSASAPAAA